MDMNEKGETEGKLRGTIAPPDGLWASGTRSRSCRFQGRSASGRAFFRQLDEVMKARNPPNGVLTRASREVHASSWRNHCGARVQSFLSTIVPNMI